MKIIVADKISERGIELLRATGWEIVLPTAAALLSEIVNADGLIVRSATKVTSALLDGAEKLRVVGRAGVGVDNVDMDAATHRGVLVMNTPGGNAVSVAEHTFALLLALARGAALAQMKKGARLINCARGELIDEGALAEALRSGHLSGAAVDTFAQEPPKNSPLIGLPNLIATPHIAGSTAEAQEEVGTLIALQVRDYLAEGLIRNAVNMPALSAEQYRRLRPYLELGERLGAFVAQAAAQASFSRVRIRYAGEPAELGSHVIRSAVLIGILNSVLDEKVNLVNASQAAAARGLIVEETTRRRERGYPNTLEVAAENGGHALTVEGTVAQDGSPRILLLDGIELEAPLEGT